MDKWDALEPSEQTWATWKKMFKYAEKEEKIRKQATGGKDQFGAAHCVTGDNLVPDTPPAPPMGKTQGESLDEYFDALAAAASKDQNVLAELVANVTKLTAANATLTEAVSQLNKANAALSEKVQKAGRGRGYEDANPRPKKLCPHCKRMTEHPPRQVLRVRKEQDSLP
jgi:hypothetical protein